jgi:uncharacterized protein
MPNSIEEPQPATLNPITHMERITALDILRGFVLCGILLMNITGFGLAGAYSNPTVSGGSTGWNLYAWITTNMFFEGTMRAMFSMLFGVGTYILLERLDHRKAGMEAADIFMRRMCWMLFFGLVHGYLLLWTGEILYDYALMGFLVFPFRKVAPKKLIMIAIFLFAAGAVWSYFQYKADIKLVENAAIVEKKEAAGEELTKELKEAKFKWEKIQEHKSPEFVKETNENMRKGYFKVVAFLAPINMETDTLWFYRYNLWDILSMMLLGIVLYKLKIITGEKSAKFYALMVLAGYGIGLSVNYWEVTTIMNSNFAFLAYSKTNLTYDIGRVAIVLGHVGAIMLFSKANILNGLKRSIAAVGKMALSNYIMHSLICMVIFTGVGFGMFGKLQRYELYFVVFAIWIFQLIVSPIWLRYFYYGPMEWVWRTLSYRNNPHFRKRGVHAGKGI